MPNVFDDQADEPHRDPDGLPDSNDPSGTCPRCGRSSAFQVGTSIPLTFGGGWIQDGSGVRRRPEVQRATHLTCRACELGLVVVEDKYVGSARWDRERRGGNITWRGFHWWPTPSTAPQDEAVPEQVRDAMEEADRCRAARAPRAAAVMLRRALEAVLHDQDPDLEGTLFQRLQALTESNPLVESLADWAHEIRLVGNTGGHFDPMDDVAPDEADDLAELTLSLVDVLYITPAKVARRRAKRGS